MVKQKDNCSYVPDGKANAACGVHDVDYAVIREMRKRADEEFLWNMLGDGVWKVKAYVYYYGVRIFGRFVI